MNAIIVANQSRIPCIWLRPAGPLEPVAAITVPDSSCMSVSGADVVGGFPGSEDRSDRSRVSASTSGPTANCCKGAEAVAPDPSLVSGIVGDPDVPPVFGSVGTGVFSGSDMPGRVDVVTPAMVVVVERVVVAVSEVVVVVGLA